MMNKAMLMDEHFSKNITRCIGGVHRGSVISGFSSFAASQVYVS